MSNFFQRTLTSLILVIILYLSFKFSIVNFLLLISIFYLIMVEFNSLFKSIFNHKKIYYFLTIILSLLYTTTFILSIFLLLNIDNNKSPLILLLIICISTDIGGYLFGKLIGGKKITKISPNKTYSGLIGSLIFAIIFGYIFSKFSNNLFNIELNIFIFIIFISLLSQIGDLIISLIKRKAGLKDTGFILPGHGGILDRLDGMMLALPIGILFIIT